MQIVNTYLAHGSLTIELYIDISGVSSDLLRYVQNDLTNIRYYLNSFRVSFCFFAVVTYL